jgi:hypothetical protein
VIDIVFTSSMKICQALFFFGAAHTVILKPRSDHANTPQVGRTTFAKVFAALWQQNEASDS